MPEKYTVRNYTEETYCDLCGRLLTVGDTVYPTRDELHVFCSSYCKGQTNMSTTNDEACQQLAEALEEARRPRCGFQAFGIMPPCILDPGHAGEHLDGIGGHYTPTDSEFELVQVPGSKELRYEKKVTKRDQLALFAPVI